MTIDKLDLHGVKHEDVRRIVTRFIEANWASNKELDIITGYSSKMKGIIKELLDEYGLYYSAETLAPKIVVWME